MEATETALLPLGAMYSSFTSRAAANLAPALPNHWFTELKAIHNRPTESTQRDIKTKKRQTEKRDGYRPWWRAVHDALSAKSDVEDEVANALLVIIVIEGTSLVRGLLVLVALLVGSSLGLIGGLLLVRQLLPLVAEDLSDLAELDAGVILTDLVALLIGEEHVGGETTLGGIGVLLALATDLSVGLGGLALGGSFLRHGDEEDEEVLNELIEVLVQDCERMLERSKAQNCMGENSRENW